MSFACGEQKCNTSSARVDPSTLDFIFTPVPRPPPVKWESMTSQTFLLVYKAITQGLIIGFCTAALIGPINFMAVRRGILGGFQQTFLVGAGAALVDATCAYAVFSGLLKVGFSGLWKIILWGICAVFLLYLAYAFLNEVRDSPEIMENTNVQKQTQFVDDPFVMGLLLAGSNP